MQDPAKRPLTADERTLLETQKAEAEAEALRLRLEEATNAGKRKLMTELKQAGLTKITGLEVAQAFRPTGHRGSTASASTRTSCAGWWRISSERKRWMLYVSSKRR